MASIIGRYDLPVLDRFSLQIEVAQSGCWIWRGGTTLKFRRGYGRLRVNGQKRLAHIFSFETFVRPIPLGLVLDHICRNSLCVNPSHLVPVTNAVNILIGEGRAARESRMQFCLNGHDLIWRIVRCNGRRILQRYCPKCVKRRDALRRRK